MVDPQLVERLRQDAYGMQPSPFAHSDGFASPLSSIEALAYGIGHKSPAVRAEGKRDPRPRERREERRPEPRRNRRGDRRRVRRRAQRLLRQPHRRRGDEALSGAVARRFRRRDARRCERSRRP
jgi:hypothetical protein